MIAERIRDVAMSYVGQQEKPGNKGWENPNFELKMLQVGWKPGNAWCSFQAELIWKEAYGKSHPLWKALDKLFSPSATATYGNFHGSDHFKVGSAPKLGALAVWRLGNGWQGHIGVVVNPKKAQGVFETVEGNTNKEGGREGMFTLVKQRRIGQAVTPRGLNLIGFVYPTETNL